MKTNNLKTAATPINIKGSANECGNVAIVYDDFAGLPLKISNIDGRWWVTTPNNQLQPLEEQYGGMDATYFYLCAPGEVVGALARAKLLGRSIENPCFPVEDTLRHRIAELKRWGIMLNPKDEALTLELDAFANPSGGRRHGKYSVTCRAVGNCYEPLFDCDTFDSKVEAEEYAQIYFDFLDELEINYSFIKKNKDE